uniref:Uncharacterized protein n=1 Tax=Anguilla anguilla TaxID=7936 RepID=A0A0E9XH14_ANGAN
MKLAVRKNADTPCNVLITGKPGMTLGKILPLGCNCLIINKQASRRKCNTAQCMYAFKHIGH